MYVCMYVIVANCPGISGTVPNFLPVSPEESRKSALAQIVPEKLWLSRKSIDCLEITTGVATPPQVTISVLSTKHFLGATYCG